MTESKKTVVFTLSPTIAKNIIYLPFKCKLFPLNDIHQSTFIHNCYLGMWLHRRQNNKYNCDASYKPHLKQLLRFLAQLLVQILLLFLQLALRINASLAIWLACQLLQLVCTTQTISCLWLPTVRAHPIYMHSSCYHINVTSSNNWLYNTNSANIYVLNWNNINYYCKTQLLFI